MGWMALAGAALGALTSAGDKRGAESQAADQLAQANQRTLDWRDSNILANRADQIGPDGTVTFGKGPDGQLTKTTTLSGDNQQIYDNLTQGKVGLSQGIAQTLGQGLDTSGLPGWQNVMGSGATNLMTHDWLGNAGNSQGIATADAGTRAAFTPSGGPTLARVPPGMGQQPSAGGFAGGGSSGGSGGSATAAVTPAVPAKDPFAVRDTFDASGVTTQLPSSIDDTSRQRVEEALMSRLNPQFAQDESSLRNRLLNSGIEVGTDAYNREMGLHNQKLTDARMQAILAGGQEETRQTNLLQGLNKQQFDQALATGKFGQDADIAMAANATSRNNAATAAGASSGAAGAAQQGAMDRLKMQLAQQSNEFNVNTGFKAAEFNNNLRQAQLAEQILMRQTPMSEVAMLNKLTSGVVPSYEAGYYTDSAKPFGPPQQQQQTSTMGGMLGGMKGLNDMWNMEW